MHCFVRCLRVLRCDERLQIAVVLLQARAGCREELGVVVASVGNVGRGLCGQLLERFGELHGAANVGKGSVPTRKPEVAQVIVGHLGRRQALAKMR